MFLCLCVCELLNAKCMQSVSSQDYQRWKILNVIIIMKKQTPLTSNPLKPVPYLVIVVNRNATDFTQNGQFCSDGEINSKQI